MTDAQPFAVGDYVELPAMATGANVVAVQAPYAILALETGRFYLAHGNHDEVCDGTPEEGAAEFDTLEAAQGALFHVLKTAIGDTFAALLKDALTRTQWEEMRRRNALPEYAANVCASHDFCDSNEVMADAFAEHVGRELCMDDSDPRQEPDYALWGAAWDYAKEAHLTDWSAAHETR